MKTQIEPHSCLLLGYAGFNNIGADVRIISTIEDIRACFGEAATITVASVVPAKTANILQRDAGVKVVSIPFIFPFLKLLWLISRHDVTFLVEGSTFKQNWGCALLYVFLWSAWCAKLLRKKCVTYAVDVGELTPLNRVLTRHICNGLDLIITRSENARERLLGMGVRTKILVNTDTAFRFLPSTGAGERCSPEKREVVGIAPIEFHQWPVRMKLLGKRQESFRWPYYFSWDHTRREKSNRMIANYKRLIEHCITFHDLDVILISMDDLDVLICEQILDAVDIEYRPRMSMLSSKKLTPYDMVPKLREINYLVASRYHACVLSMGASVPQMTICHDERLEALYAQLELGNDFLLNYQDPLLAEKFIPTFDLMVNRSDELAAALKRKHDEYFLPRCEQNCIDLRAWINKQPKHSKASAIPGPLSGSEGVSSA